VPVGGPCSFPGAWARSFDGGRDQGVYVGADRLAYAYRVTYGVPVMIVRPSNNYGPFQYPEKFIPLFVTNALEGKALPLYGRGLNVRDWLFVEDNCRAIDLVARRGAPGEAYNIGLGESYEVFELAQMMFSILGLEGVEVVARGGESWQGDVPLTQPNVSKAEREMGWKARVGIRAGLERTLAWFESRLGPVGGKKRF